jgi:hypothetical protein
VGCGWQWIVGPPVALLAAASTMAGLGQAGTVADELSRVVGLVVPLVGALLAPLVGGIVFLFKALVVEMRANRQQTEKLTEVVVSNTAAFEANTVAAQRLSDGVAALNARMDRLENRIDHDHAVHDRRQHA